MSKGGDEGSGGSYSAAAGEFAGRKMPEGKSKFSVTCGRLSRYLKENGSFGDLGLGISHSFEPQAQGQSVTPTGKTKSAPTIIDLSADDSPTTPASFLPDLNTTTSTQISHNKNLVWAQKKPEMEQQGSQMTIFYRGKVLVFDHFTVDKVNELVAIANRKNAPIPAANPINFQQSPTQSTPTSRPDRFNCPPPRNTSPASTSGNNQIPIHNINNPAAATPHMSITSDLPIARRVSLNRFLEKRKDRIVSKAPYQTNESPGLSSEKKGGEGCSGFGKPEERPVRSAVLGEELSLGKNTIEPQSPEEKKWLGLATEYSSSSSSMDRTEHEIQQQ